MTSRWSEVPPSSWVHVAGGGGAGPRRPGDGVSRT